MQTTALARAARACPPHPHPSRPAALATLHGSPVHTTHLPLLHTPPPTPPFLALQFDFELYNRNDIERILGDKAWAISFKDSACRCFGYMVSKKKYIYTSEWESVGRLEWSTTYIYTSELESTSTPVSGWEVHLHQ